MKYGRGGLYCAQVTTASVCLCATIARVDRLRAVNISSVGYRRPGGLQFCRPPKVVRCLMPPLSPHFCRPFCCALPIIDVKNVEIKILKTLKNVKNVTRIKKTFVNVE